MEWNGPAYQRSTGTLYVATVDWCGMFTQLPDAPQFAENAHYYGGAVTPDPRDQARGWLYRDRCGIRQGALARQWPTPLVAAVTATSGGGAVYWRP